MATSPADENIYLKALELCDKYELPRTKPNTEALCEMYRCGAVWAVKTMNDVMNPEAKALSDEPKS